MVRLKLLIFFTITLILFFVSCNNIFGTKGTKLVANAGHDQTTKAGSYVILDGTGSSAGEGDRFVWCEWTADENNPAEVFLMSGEGKDHLIQTIGFIKEGMYKFILVVNNGIQNSEPDEVTVTVNPRDNIIFEDPNLEVHVRYGLKKPTEELTDIILASIDSVVSYDITVREITSLVGIEKCVNLKHLAMGHQRIVDLSPLANLTSLIFLNLTQNRHIKDISHLRNLTQLRYLNLDSNEIFNISPLENLTKLKFLHLQYNQLTDISVIANMRDLEELWVGDLLSGDISSLVKLEKLYILWLADCQITDLTPIANLINLRLLYLNYNSIVNIKPLAGLIQLERLYLRYNQIVDISSLKNLTELDLLLLGHNKINNILPLVNNSGLKNGDFVNLSSNPLSEISISEYIPALRSRGVNVIWP